jgi:site-specific DNA-adenine methylase
VNSLFLLGIVFLTISVIGQSKLLFLEINPGCFGRLLALFIGSVSLYFALTQGATAIPNFDIFINFIQNLIPDLENFVKQIQLSS